MLAVAVVALGAFVAPLHAGTQPAGRPALFRVRAFTGASVAMTLFSVAFGAMLLSIVLWVQDVWGWSALEAGLAVAPGPVMVPVFAFLVAGRLIARFGAGPVVAAGRRLRRRAASLGRRDRPRAALRRAMLGGMLLTGVGVGLTLPTLMATAAASLPPESFATGSGVINMLRQVGIAIGVAILIAVLGTPATPDEALDVFRTGWAFIGISSLTAAIAGGILLAPRRGERGVQGEAGGAGSPGVV